MLYPLYPIVGMQNFLKTGVTEDFRAISGDLLYTFNHHAHESHGQNIPIPVREALHASNDAPAAEFQDPEKGRQNSPTRPQLQIGDSTAKP